MSKVILRYGLYGGIFISIALGGTVLLMQNDELHGKWGMVYGYATMLVAFTSIFFAVRSFRNQQADGRVGFGKALLIGLGITLMAGTFYTATWLIYVSTAGKGFEDKYSAMMEKQMQQEKAATIEQMKKDGKSQEEIDKKDAGYQKQMEDSKKMMALYRDNIFVKAGFTYIEILPVGLLVSLIAGFAAILQDRKANAPA